jgi:hypothetical protein
MRSKIINIEVGFSETFLLVGRIENRTNIRGF